MILKANVLYPMKWIMEVKMDIVYVMMILILLIPVEIMNLIITAPNVELT